MVMVRTFFLLIALITYQFGFSQIINIGEGHQGKYGFMGTDNSIQGTKYYFNAWGVGKINFADGKISGPKFLQLDLETNTLLIKDEKDDTRGLAIAIGEVEKFTIAIIGGSTENVVSDIFLKKSPSDFDAPPKQPKYYRQLTRNSDYVIEEINKSIFDHATDNTANFDKKSYKEYRTSNTFHIKSTSGKYQKANNLNERAFAKAYPHVQKKIKEYIKSQRIDFENPDHLDSIISFCLGEIEK